MLKKNWMAIAVLCSMVASVAVAEGGHASHDKTDGKSMKGMKHEMMGHMGMGTGDEDPADQMAAMHAKMEALHEHTMKMDRMGNRDALIGEMKKHMKMLDELVAGMMSRMMMNEEM